MIVHLSSDSPARLGELDRLDRLHAECAGSPRDATPAHWYTLDDDAAHVWLDIAACRDIGRAELGDGWVDRYDAMVAYATAKGWTDAAGTAVRAHIEPIDRIDRH